MSAPQSNPDIWTEQARQWAQSNLQITPLPPQTTGSTSMLRPEIEVGRLDSRLRLAPCNRIEPFLPEDSRLWGRSRVGLRCTQGPVAWQIHLPVTVRVWGPAWVLRQAVAAGTILTPEHVETREVDWADSPLSVLARPEDWQGLQTTRTLMPGQTLRQGMVKPRRLFTAGTQVRLTAQGKGFTLTVTGEALGHGFAGQPVRVRLPNHKVLSGTARGTDSVELRI